MVRKKKSRSTKSSPSRKKVRRRPGSQGEGEFRSSDDVRTALVDGATFRGRALQYTVVDGLALFEGDIVLGTEEEIRRKTEQARAEATGVVAHGVVRTGDQFRWPDCRIPYTIDPSLPNQNRVTDAIAHWEERTRYRFVPRTSEADYVTFRPAGGCSSSVGRQGGQQFVNLAAGCSTGNTIHEIGHVVGLWHEQSREDRDSFVTIVWDKIISGREHNFNQHITDGDDVGPYDYGSIMHYPRNAFSVDGSDTIIPTTSGVTIGQRTALSDGDIAAANSLCPPKVLKEGTKDAIMDTRKETIKDLRADTRKEIIHDTIKEMLKDRVKEVALDPPPGTLVEQPTLPVGPVPRPGFQPGAQGPARPFAVATPHQAPAAAGTEAASTVAQLDAQLQQLSEQLLQADANRQALQDQYDETAALLQQVMAAQEGGGG